MRQCYWFVKQGLLRRTEAAYNESIIQRAAYHADTDQFKEFLSTLEDSDG